MEEATRIFRLPLPLEGETPGLPSTHPAYEALPKDLPAEGPVLGVKKTGQAQQLIRLHPHDLRRHAYILGQTGTGKTTMLASMLQERIEAGASVGLIDPHGDLFDAVRRAVPKERTGDVILFDPGDRSSLYAPSETSQSVRLNLLEYDPRYPEQRSVLIESLFDIFDQEYDLKRVGGPIFETYMRNALLLVMDDPVKAPGTFLDVIKVFQDEDYRRRRLAMCKNPLVVDFWEKEAAGVTYHEMQLNNVAPYVTSKLNAFVYNDYLRTLLGERRSTLRFRELIDEVKILLVRLPKGKLGGFGVRMFGTVLFTRLLMAALSREDTHEEERPDFFLFVDEFQHFTSRAVAEMLSEARKYRLSLVLANQTLGQLDDRILHAVLGNTGSLVFFRPGVEDYDRIKPYVTPPFTREEMLALPNYTASARLLIEGRPADPFLFQTCPSQ